MIAIDSIMRVMFSFICFAQNIESQRGYDPLYLSLYARSCLGDRSSGGIL